MQNKVISIEVSPFVSTGNKSTEYINLHYTIRYICNRSLLYISNKIKDFLSLVIALCKSFRSKPDYLLTAVPYRYLTSWIESCDNSFRIFTARLMWSRTAKIVRIAANSTISWVLFPLNLKRKTIFVCFIDRSCLSPFAMNVNDTRFCTLTGITTAKQFVVVVIHRIGKSKAPHRITGWWIHQSSMSVDWRRYEDDLSSM